MDIDIYDFDGTIVPFDSGSLFWGYCMVHYPWTLILLPIQIVATFLAVSHIISFTQYKRVCFLFVPLVPLDKAVKGFWNKYEKRVFPWFHERSREAVVISASPDFLLEEICRRIHIKHLICTNHNRKNGVIIGENCRNEEKVRRFTAFYPDAVVHDVYSDSLRHDKPIFSLANDSCYHIVKGRKINFDYKTQYEARI